MSFIFINRMLTTISDEAFQVVLVVKNPPANAGDIRDMSSIPGSERSPGGGHGNSLQYSCLENPMTGGAWWTTVYGTAESWTQLKRLSTYLTHSNGQLLAIIIKCLYMPGTILSSPWILG